ncbi:MAG: tRNA (N6-isopentenyl adenosine(37)-C2)-methylthiotransferase MiaB, partial [Spirochaetota bacterium]
MKKLKFYIETFGCQMNKSDSELMNLSMTRSGFSPAADEGDADIVIFNTCSVRNHAEERALSRIRRTRSSLPRSIIVVAGCMAQRLGTDLLK